MSNRLLALGRSFALGLPLVTAPVLVGCAAGQSEDSATEQSAALTASPDTLNIGFGGAGIYAADDPFQFAALSHFHAKQTVSPGASLCHRYLSWDIGTLAAGSGDPTDPTSRANFDDWLASIDPATGQPTATPNPCQDVLVSFKYAGDTATRAPTDFHYLESGCKTCFGNAFQDFLDQFTDTWASKGAGHVFSFTAWNEPNNGAGAGDGWKDHPLSAITAGQYYLMARSRCGRHPSRCKVAAGDMASNGTMIDDFQKNCANDMAGTLCAKASWLDAYKHFIWAHANDPAFQLGSGFTPEYWAYHAWQEINDYNERGDDCTSDAKCATRAMLTSLQGAWGNGKIWDTEVGSGQDAALSDEVQAKGAAYILYLSSHLSDRIGRIYYQGVESGPWQLTCSPSGTTPTFKDRPSFDVLAERKTSYTGGSTKTCG
jgi:hypothetical protein